MKALELCLQTETELAYNVAMAREHGVARLELCARMDLAGLTPTPGQIALARRYWGDGPGLVAMLRPRGGDFCYSVAELKQLQCDMGQLATAGADAVVFGALTTTGQWQLQAMSELVATAVSCGLSVACHRAIDACVNPMQAWLELSDLAFVRVLSAGSPWLAQRPALEGIVQFQSFVDAGGPELVIGGGVTASNIAAIRQALPVDAVYSFHLHGAVQQQGRLKPQLLQAVLAQLA